MQWIVEKSVIEGQVAVPPSKSHTMRAILFASLASGTSRISNWLESPDVMAMIRGCELFGASIEMGQTLVIRGTGGALQTPTDVIDAGNSGQVLRFLAALAPLAEGLTVITGDHSIRHRRPIAPLLQALTQLGAKAVSSKGDGHAPVVIGPSFQGGSCQIRAQDSQLLSALLMAAPFGPHDTEICCDEVGERPWVLLTLDWLERMGIRYEQHGWERFVVFGGQQLQGFDYTVPADWSSAAFGIALGLLAGDVALHGLQQDIQGDKAIVPLLQDLGANLVWEEDVLRARKSALVGGVVDVNHVIDAVPILAVLGTQMRGGLQITGAEIARQKESDRLAVMGEMLGKMGAQIELTADGMQIKEGALRGASVSGCEDHRVALALSVAGMIAEGETQIEGVECVAKTYGSWAQAVRELGGKIEGERAKRVWLVGLPAAGKSTLAKALGEALGVAHFDTDEQIERLVGMSCREFAQKYGEAKFREIERGVIRSMPEGIIAVGGGGWIDNRLEGVVLRVDADRKVLWERIQRRGGHSLAATWEAFEELCDQREGRE